MSEYREWTHDVELMRQPTPDSCWWACASMLFRHRLRQGHFIQRPEQVDPIFTERSGTTGSLEQLQLLQPRSALSVIQDRRYRTTDRFGNDIMAGSWPRGFLHPCHWYRLGVPVELFHFGCMARLLRLRPVHGFSPDELRNRDAWLRAVKAGPMMLALTVRPGGRVPGSRSAYHFVVVHHVREKLEDGRLTEVKVRFRDPADDIQSDYFEVVAFSDSVARQQVGANAALHYAGGRAREPECEESADF